MAKRRKAKGRGRRGGEKTGPGEVEVPLVAVAAVDAEENVGAVEVDNGVGYVDIINIDEADSTNSGSDPSALPDPNEEPSAPKPFQDQFGKGIDIEKTFAAISPAATVFTPCSGEITPPTRNTEPVGKNPPLRLVFSRTPIARNPSTGSRGIPGVIEKRSAAIPKVHTDETAGFVCNTVDSGKTIQPIFKKTYDIIPTKVLINETATSAFKAGDTGKAVQPIFKKPYDVIPLKDPVGQTVAGTQIEKLNVNGEATKPSSNPFYLIRTRTSEMKSCTGKNLKKAKKELKRMGIPKKVKKSLTSFLGDKEKYNIKEMVREVNLGLKQGETEDKFCSLGSILRCPPIMGTIRHLQPEQMSGFRLFHNAPIYVARSDGDTPFDKRKDGDGTLKTSPGVTRKKTKY